VVNLTVAMAALSLVVLLFGAYVVGSIAIRASAERVRARRFWRK
jgi:hypothetical protein